MKKIAKSRAISFALMCVMVLSMLLAFAVLEPVQSFAAWDESDEHHEACASDAVTIDWSQYKEELAETKYNLRVSEKMLPEVETLVLTYLVEDGIVPSSALSEHATFENTDVLERFIVENVKVDSVYGQICCPSGTMRREWVGICLKYRLANGICVRHCAHYVYMCRNCFTIWDKRHDTSAGCGNTKKNCSIYLQGYDEECDIS